MKRIRNLNHAHRGTNMSARNIMALLFILAYTTLFLGYAQAATQPRIAAGWSFTAVIKSDGTLWAWGDDYDGQLGDGPEEHFSPSPIQVGTENAWAFIAASASDSAFAIKSDGTLWAWGNNFRGQLGNGTGEYKTSHQHIGADNKWV